MQLWWLPDMVSLPPMLEASGATVWGWEIFFCRHCYNLAYGSQQESRPFRLMRKAQNIRERLGGSANLSEPFPWKPKNMHWKTFDRLRREADHANNLSWIIAGQRFGFCGM